MEIPSKFCSCVNLHIIKFVRGYRFVVLRGVAYGGAENTLVLFEKRHGVHNLLVNAVSTSVVRCFLRTLNRKSKSKIARFFHILAEFIVNERSVCERKENAILIFLCQSQNVLFANKRLTAGEHKEMSAKLL